MGDHPTDIRNHASDCAIHATGKYIRYDDDCKNCSILDKDKSSIDSWSLSSTAVEDNRSGPGRGLDQIVQCLGRCFDRFVGVGKDKLGYGPAAAERRATKAIMCLSPDGFNRIGFARGKRITPPAASDFEQAERKVREDCKKLAKYSQSSVPTTQLLALNAFWKIRCVNPIHVDDLYRELGLAETVQSIHDSLVYMKHHPKSVITLWKIEYARPYNGDLLDSLLASSRKALLAINDNELHTAAKSLLELKGGYGSWIPPRYARIVPHLRTLSKYVLDPELAFMAVAYVERIGLQRDRDHDDEELLIASASIAHNLRASCLFHSKRLRAEGEALPNTYRRTVWYINGIVMMISLFPPEDQKRFRFPVENGNNAPPGVVELELLEKAACRVWQWILREFAGIAQKEGRRNFLNIHEKRVIEKTKSLWESIERGVAYDWFEELARESFHKHYKCADCVNKPHCDYSDEAFHCYTDGNLDWGEIAQEFRKDDESFRTYASTQMTEWRRHTTFSHEHGRRVRWLITGAI